MEKIRLGREISGGGKKKTPTTHQTEGKTVSAVRRGGVQAWGILAGAYGGAGWEGAALAAEGWKVVGDGGGG